MDQAIQHIYGIQHGAPLGHLIAWYLWLISLAEGTHIVAHLSWLYYRKPEIRPLEKVGTFLPFIILALVPLLLVADLGHPERFYTMFYNWHWTSPVAYGVYIITLCMISYAVHSYYLFRPELIVRAREEGLWPRLYRLLLMFSGRPGGTAEEIHQRQQRRERTWAAISLAFSFLGLIYLGILLASFKGRVMWHSTIMVFIFTSFGLTSGAAFLILFTHLKNILTKTPEAVLARQRFYLSRFGAVLKYALIAQAAVLFVYLVMLYYTGTGGHLAAQVFLSGARSLQFWVLVVAVGLIVPFGLSVHHRLRDSVPIACLAAVAALIGTFTGVVGIFLGGQSLPLTGFRWEHLAPEPGKMAFGLIIMAVMLAVFLVSYKVLPYENLEG
jgi:formate-dependent nitrite reductase membrane component NrfD